MRIIGVAGKRNSDKDAVAEMLKHALSSRGYTVRLATFSGPNLRIVNNACLTPFIANQPQDDTELPFIHGRRTTAHFARILKEGGADYLVIHDVLTEEEVRFCRENGVVIYILGSHSPAPEVERYARSHLEPADLFFGADHIIPALSLARLGKAVNALVEAGGFLRAM